MCLCCIHEMNYLQPVCHTRPALRQPTYAPEFVFFHHFLGFLGDLRAFVGSSRILCMCMTPERFYLCQVLLVYLVSLFQVFELVR